MKNWKTNCAVTLFFLVIFFGFTWLTLQPEALADTHTGEYGTPRLVKFVVVQGCAKAILAVGTEEAGTKVTVALCADESVTGYVGHDGHQVYDIYWAPDYP